MGVYVRSDSPFYWMVLERPGQRPLRRSTNVPRDAPTREQAKANRRLAEEIYATAMGDLARRRFRIPTEQPRTTFRAYRDWYADHVSKHKRGETRERSMLRQIGAFFDSRRLDEITREFALEWRTWRREAVSASTVNREQELLIHMLNVAVPKYLEANPLTGLQRLRTKSYDVRILSHDEERRLLEQLAPEDQALVVCALDTLARLSDVVNLRRDQDHGAYLSFLDTKVDAYKVPVSTRLRTALDALPDRGPFYFAQHHRVRRGLKPAPTDPARASRAAASSVIRMFTKACAAAEIPLGRKGGGVSFHVLRHTGASRMLAAGVDVKTVMDIGGWRNLAVMKRYPHPSDEQKRRAVDAIAQPA